MSDSEEEVSERQFKVVLLGDPETGKTSIATRYAQEVFSKQYKATVGVEFYLKRTVLPGQKNVALKIWDVSGRANEGSMLDKYVYGADLVILVYDVTPQYSFESLAKWLATCNEILKANNQTPQYALVANKIDLEHLRTVKSERHHKFAQENNLLTYAVSAKSGEGANLCFQKMCAELMGIRLSRTDQEQHQTVVRAEIVTYRHDRIQVKPQGNVKTSVCSLQ